MTPSALLRLLPLLALGCAHRVVPAAQLDVVPPSTLTTLDPQVLMGTWIVQRTTLDFWRDRAHPQLVYVRLPGADARWLDTVHYQKDGRARTVVGVDVQDATLPGHFQWRGRGLLRLLTSHCFVVLMAEDAQWAVTWFSRTAATPEGIDLIVRAPLDATTLAAVEARILADPFLGPRYTHAFSPATAP